MKRLWATLRVRPRLVASIGAGVAAGLALPGSYEPVTRALLGWNVGAWTYLVLAAIMMFRADHARTRRASIEHAEGAGTVLLVVVLATIASLVGIGVELAAKDEGGGSLLPRALFALVTVASAWLIVPTCFALNYGSLYHRHPKGEGLVFPEATPGFQPDYADFLYFAFTIAVAAQTADVAISTRPMRRLALVQQVLSFAFNAVVLAFAINIAAGLR